MVAINITLSRASIFSSDMTMISYFNIIINIIIITNPKFSRVQKIFIIFFSHHKFFVKRNGQFTFLCSSPKLSVNVCLMKKLKK